ncbi:MAG: class I SAM-dependent methyltransferase [Candidatus Blackburnbacteria bacterium]|nr:class I SAM-dependent methyltransferase [Candidatus Blackburnbacteria bacterium]
MEIGEYRNIYENEETHFFYVGNHKIILSLIRKYFGGIPKNLKILDAGCGTGLLAKKLAKFGDVGAIDSSREAVRFSKKRGVRVLLASVNKLPFKDNFFDLVVSVDVIYHKAVDDKGALGEFFRVLKPNGILILRVPANSWLGTLHDEHVHTRERYSKGELKNKLEDTDFIIEKLSFVNLSLAPLALARRLWEEVARPERSASAIGNPPRLLNNLLSFLLFLEARFLAIGDLPLGIGLIAVCRKPGLGDEIPSSKKSR